MSVLVGAAIVSTGLTVGSKIYSGVQAEGVDSQAGVDASGNLAIAEKQQQANEQRLAMSKIDWKQETLMDAATTKGRDSMFDIFKFQEAAGATGFTSSDATNVAIESAKEKSYDTYGTSVDSILKESELSKKGVSLAALKENADIEKRLQSNITAATSQADTFWEGFAGQGDYEVR